MAGVKSGMMGRMGVVSWKLSCSVIAGSAMLFIDSSSPCIGLGTNCWILCTLERLFLRS